MVIPAQQARDELFKRLGLVFGDSFESFYKTQKPDVFLGNPVNEPPFYVSVDEIIDTASTDGAASMGHAKVSFELNVFLCAINRDLITASNTLLTYIDAVFASVLADQTLNSNVDNAFPRINSAGTAADSSKRYIAAANVVISCEVGSACPAYIRELINGTNSY